MEGYQEGMDDMDGYGQEGAMEMSGDIGDIN